MSKPQITVVHIPKGGNKKTTTAVTLADLAAHRGQRVLLIDGDPNENCSDYFLLPEQRKQTLAHAILGQGGTVADLVIRDIRPNLDFLPSGGARLARAAEQLPHLFDSLEEGTDSEKRRWVIESFVRNFGDLSEYDQVFIDTWPHVGDLLYLLLYGSHDIIVPINAEDSSLRMLRKLNKRIEFINQVRNSNPLFISHIVLFRSDNSRHEQDAQALIEKHFPEQFAGVVGKCTAFRDAFSHQQTIREFFGPEGRRPQKNEQEIMTFLTNLTDEIAHVS